MSFPSCVVLRHFLVTLLLPVLMLASPGVRAQTVPVVQYCYAGGCHDNLIDAESAMRDAHPAGALLQQQSTTVQNNSSGIPSGKITYFVPPQPPTSILAPYYMVASHGVAQGICSASDGPAGDVGCRDEQQAIDSFYQMYVLPNLVGCNPSPMTLLNEQVAPFGYTSSEPSAAPTSGVIYYVHPHDVSAWKTYRVTFDCGHGAGFWDHKIYKWTFYACAAGLAPNTGESITVADPGEPFVEYSTMCRSLMPRPYITVSAITQVACPSGNCHPTYPGSGDKARFETDLVFAGRPFVRTYHSIQQVSQEFPMAPGWHHSYAWRMLASSGGSSKAVLDDRGYVDLFDVVSSGLYRSRTNPDRILRVDAGIQRLIEPDGLVREFTSSGRLLRVLDPANPAADVTLTYDGNGRISRLTDGRGRTLDLVHDGGGHLLALELDGEDVLYDYDADGNLVEVTYSDGATREYHYHESGLAGAEQVHHLTGITDENGDRYASFGYGADGRVVLSKLHTGNPASPTHDQTTLSYVDADTVELTTGTGDVVEWTIAPGATRRTAARVDARGTTTNVYDSNERLTQATDPAGVITQYGYASTYRDSITEAVGTAEERRTLIQRDTLQRLIGSTIQRKVAGSFVDTAIMRATVDGNGRTTATCSYDPGSASAAYVCGSSANGPTGVRQTTFTYCDATDVAATSSTCPVLGLPKSVDGPRLGTSDTVTFAYYAADDTTGCLTPFVGNCHRKGDLYSRTNGFGHASLVQRYDLAGRPVQVRDPNQVITRLTYDERGRLTTQVTLGPDNGNSADDATTTFAYDHVGQMVAMTGPDGSTLTLGYDDAHRLVEVADGLGNTLRYTLDGAGNRVAEQARDGGNVLKRTLSRVFDDVGRVESLLDASANPTDITYDAAGNVDTVTDALNRTTDNAYDALGRLRETIANVGGTGAQRAQSQFAYDTLDGLTSVIDPNGLTTSYTYNGLGDLVALASPDTGTTSYGYDAAGNRTSSLDARGIATTYVYDRLYRLIDIDVPTAGQDVAYDNDSLQSSCQTGETFPIGHLGRMDDASGSTKYCWDRRGNLVRKTQAVTGATADRSVVYGYDLADRVTSVTYPSGASVSYTRDPDTGRITAVSGIPAPAAAAITLLSDVDYLPFGPATQLTYGNGRKLIKTYDQDYGIEEIHDLLPGGAPGGFAIEFGTDDVGNIVALDEAVAGGTTASRTIGYDGLDRVTALDNGATHVQAFTYDATGNRLTKTTGASTATYAYASNTHRLTSDGVVSRTLDAAGHGTAIGAKTFVYDDYGRMIEYRNGGTLTRAYTYNGHGERVARWNVLNAANDMIFVYDEAGHLIGEYRKDGTRVREIVWMDDTPVAIFHGPVASPTLYYILTDHLNTPRAIVNPPNNGIIWRWDITGSVFGEHAVNEDPDNNGSTYLFNLRYPGQYYDSDTGLHYNYFRDYDPGTGRYLQSDPIGLAGGVSTFSYVGSASLGGIDPNGLLAGPEPAPIILTPPVSPAPLPLPQAAPMAWLSEVLPLVRGFSAPILALWPSELGAAPCEMSGGPLCGQSTAPASLGARLAYDNQTCRSLRATIESLRREVFLKRIPGLESNATRSNPLPERIGPGEELGDTVRGHRKLLDRQWRRLRELEDRYNSECKPCP